MTPDIKQFNADQFREYIDAQEGEYTDRTLKSTNTTIAELIEFMENTDFRTQVHVRTDGRRSGTVLSLDALVLTASDIKALTDLLNTRTLDALHETDHDDILQASFRFD